MSVLLGTAGFSYRDWVGNFYPAGTRPGEMLEAYARRFPVVEINSTYYAIPRPGTLLGMARRSPPDFQFTVKANRGMTHDLPPAPGLFGRFHEAIRPLRDHGKLGCVLAQFPWGFRNTPENREYLRFVSEEMAGLDTVVEFRNSGWEDEEVFSLLARLGLCYCCVDEPGLKGLVSARVEATSPVGYVRFHGRNARNWWARGREPWERYDYLYSEEELAGWLPGIERLADRTDRVYVIFNNHYKGQAPTNAGMFEEMLRGLPGDCVKAVAGGAGETLFD